MKRLPDPPHPGVRPDERVRVTEGNFVNETGTVMTVLPNNWTRVRLDRGPQVLAPRVERIEGARHA